MARAQSEPDSDALRKQGEGDPHEYDPKEDAQPEPCADELLEHANWLRSRAKKQLKRGLPGEGAEQHAIELLRSHAPQFVSARLLIPAGSKAKLPSELARSSVIPRLREKGFDIEQGELVDGELAFRLVGEPSDSKRPTPPRDGANPDFRTFPV